jgi:DNA-binding IclR family transcriptional regulator
MRAAGLPVAVRPGGLAAALNLSLPTPILPVTDSVAGFLMRFDAA